MSRLDDRVNALEIEVANHKLMLETLMKAYDLLDDAIERINIALAVVEKVEHLSDAMERLVEAQVKREHPFL